MAQLSGKIAEILQEVSGETAMGTWIRSGIVVFQLDGRDGPVAFTGFGEEQANMIRSLKVGDVVIVEYRPYSREFAGRWFTDLRIIKVLVPQSI